MSKSAAARAAMRRAGRIAELDALGRYDRARARWRRARDAAAAANLPLPPPPVRAQYGLANRILTQDRATGVVRLRGGLRSPSLTPAPPDLALDSDNLNDSSDDEQQQRRCARRGVYADHAGSTGRLISRLDRVGGEVLVGRGAVAVGAQSQNRSKEIALGPSKRPKM